MEKMRQLETENNQYRNDLKKLETKIV